MPALHLDEHQAAVLRAAPLSYSLPGGPAGVTPAGFRHLYYSATLARRDFDATARDLFDWQMHMSTITTTRQQGARRLTASGRSASGGYRDALSPCMGAA